MPEERTLTPADNMALVKYYKARTAAEPDLRAKMEAEFEKALSEGERPKIAAERALKLVKV